MNAQKTSWLYTERLESRWDLKRQEFVDALSHIPVEKRVYMDQSGMDDTLTYTWGWSRKGNLVQEIGWGTEPDVSRRWRRCAKGNSSRF